LVVVGLVYGFAMLERLSKINGLQSIICADFPIRALHIGKIGIKFQYGRCELEKMGLDDG